MADEVIMLATPYNPDKLLFPVLVTEKMDGVAVDIYRTQDNEVRARTRDGKPVYSIDHLLSFIQENGLLERNEHLICELYITGKPFKVISGNVRRNKPCPELRAYVYDRYVDDESIEGMTFRDRMIDDGQYRQDVLHPGYFEPAPWICLAGNRMTMENAIENFFKGKPWAEGVMVRMMDGKHSLYKFGRSHGMMKLKRQATADIELVRVERAIDINGNPKDMVGRLICNFKGKEIGIGPGKLTHEERTAVWKNPFKYIGKIIEVAYMPDDSYDALREGRFHRWRDDKKEPSYA